MVDAFKADNFRVCQQADVRGLFDSTNEVFRHCVSKARTSDEYVHVLCALGQKYSSLARGISTPTTMNSSPPHYCPSTRISAVIIPATTKRGRILNRKLR